MASTTLLGTLILPVLNESARIAHQLQQLRQMAGGQWRIVVVDGGSSDDTVAQAEPWCDQCLRAPAGRARQMNAGAARAAGPLLLFLHADTRLPADFNAQLQRFIGSGQQWGRFDVQLDDSRIIFRVIATLMNLRSRWTGIATGDQAIFVLQEFFQRCNGFADIPLMEDIDFCTRARRLSQPFCITSSVLVSARRWQKQGIARTILLMWWLRLAFFLGVSPQRLHRWYYPSPCPR